jgi:hypothetical protein
MSWRRKKHYWHWNRRAISYRRRLRESLPSVIKCVHSFPRDATVRWNSSNIIGHPHSTGANLRTVPRPATLFWRWPHAKHIAPTLLISVSFEISLSRAASKPDTTGPSHSSQVYAERWRYCFHVGVRRDCCRSRVALNFKQNPVKIDHLILQP